MHFRFSFTLRILLVLPLFLACNSKPKMDRGKAMKHLMDIFSLPFNETRVIKSGKFIIDNGSSEECDIAKNYQGEQMLVSKGYRNISGSLYYRNNLTGFTDCIYTVQLTDLAQPFIMSVERTDKASLFRMKVTNITFGQLRTLREVTENEYEIEFSFNRTLTEFGEAFKQGVISSGSSRYSIPEAGPVELKARILKYDKGWRIATDDIERINRKFEP